MNTITHTKSSSKTLKLSGRGGLVREVKIFMSFHSMKTTTHCRACGVVVVAKEKKERFECCDDLFPRLGIQIILLG